METTTAIQRILSQKTVLPFILGFTVVTLIGLGLNFFASKNTQLQNALMSHSYALKTSVDLSLAQMNSALLGDQEALRQLQKATENGILSLNTLQSGNLKKGIKKAPGSIQEVLAGFAPSWNEISTTNGKILQNRSKIQSIAEKSKTITDSLVKTNELQQAVIDSLIRNKAPVKQLTIASQQQKNLYELRIAWQTKSSGNSSAHNSVASLTEKFKQSQDALLSGNSSLNVQAVQDPQTRRLIANVNNQFNSSRELISEMGNLEKHSMELQQHISDLLAQRHVFDQQVSLLISTTEDTHSAFLFQHWQLYPVFLLLFGLFLVIVTMSPAVTAVQSSSSPIIQESVAVDAPTDSTNTQANRRKAAQNQFINEIRPLGEGKLYFDVTETNESTRDLALAYNQAKSRLIQLCISVEKQSQTVQQSLTQKNQKSLEEVSKQMALITGFKDALPGLSGNSSSNITGELKNTLELSSKIRARLSLSKEKLHKLAHLDANKVSEKEFQTLKSHLDRLSQSLNEAELEQEQLSIYLRDYLRDIQENSQQDQGQKQVLQELNPKLAELSIGLNQLEDNLRETLKLQDQGKSVLDVLELDRGSRR